MKILRSSIEPLEPRIAPATLNAAGTVLTYTDIDGDLVKVTFTKATMVPGDFTFSTGTANDGLDTPRTLDGINLTGKTGAGFTLTATSHGGKGDSHANVGTISADNTDLANVSVDGNVGNITAGSGLPGTTGLKSFTALSMGRTTTNVLLTSIVQNAGAFTVKESAVDVFLSFIGNVKSISVRGNLGDFSSGSTSLLVGGNVGSLKVGGSIISTGGNDVSVKVSGATGTFSVGGSIIGGPFDPGGNLDQIELGTSARSITIGGDLRGGDGDGSGGIHVGSVGAFKVGGSIVGGAGNYASGGAQVNLGASAKSITVGGDLRSINSASGQGSGAGSVTVETVGTVKIGGSMVGTPVSGGGGFNGGSVGSFTLGHDLVGYSFGINLSGNLGSLKIGGDVIAHGVGTNTVDLFLSAGGAMGSVTIGGSIIGSADCRAYLVAAGAGVAQGLPPSRA